MHIYESVAPSAAGILIRTSSAAALETARSDFLARLAQLSLDRHVEAIEETPQRLRFRLRAEAMLSYAPAFDTLELATRLEQDAPGDADTLEKEILLAMLAAPVAFEYPSHDELAASIRVRRRIAEAARRTALSFHTSRIERPVDCWAYSEERGFTIIPGKPLIDALRKATQPEISGERYAFSCYRATEYVILLGIAQELACSNPALLDALQRQWEERAIMSRQYHEVFLFEYGTLEAPLPPRYYVPGDRLWFRNPDERSSDVDGYEGSWVIYLGNGQFSNFWECERPYTLTAKCIEIYHWRDALRTDSAGNPWIDETIVAECVAATMRDPAAIERIVAQMMQLRAPRGVYNAGGCIDASREYPRHLCPETATLMLPAD